MAVEQVFLKCQLAPAQLRCDIAALRVTGKFKLCETRPNFEKPVYQSCAFRAATDLPRIRKAQSAIR